MTTNEKLNYLNILDDGKKKTLRKRSNDFMATVKVLDVKFSGTPSSESFNSVAIVLVLYR